MAYTSPHDPKSSEARSSWLAGLTEAMSIVTRQLGLKESDTEDITLEELFIDENDRYRIFQAPTWNKLWLPIPEPIVKKDGVVINQTDDHFSIDYLGGSIVFEENYKPESEVTIVVTAKHLLGGEATNRSEVLESIKNRMETISADISSKANQSEVDEKFEEVNQSIDSKTATLTQGLNEANKSIETIKTDKQDKLTFDKTPTAGSKNPVESQGVKTYVDNAVGEFPEIDESAVESLWNGTP